MSELRKIRLFIASPGDVQTERELVARAVGELNQTVCPTNNLVLEFVAWEKDARPEMGRIQGLINHQIGDYDIFVGLMWRRFGTPSGDSGSGTEEEFNRAYSSWAKTKHPNILLYFSEAPAPPPKSVEDARQMLRVAEFREEVEGKGLTWSYSDPCSFDDVVRPHLHKLLLDEYCSTEKKPLEMPIDPKLRSLLEIEKHACRERNVSYLTSHLIVRMIEMPGSILKKSLEVVQPGVCDLLHSHLEKFLEIHASSNTSSFSNFTWEDRPEIRAAQSQAHDDGSAYIKEKHVLLSLLQSEGKTITQLKETMFPGETYEQLLAQIQGVSTERPAHIDGTREIPNFSFMQKDHPEEP